MSNDIKWLSDFAENYGKKIKRTAAKKGEQIILDRERLAGAKVGDKVNIFGPNKIDFDFEVQEILNEKNEKIDVARHPKEILKIKIPHKVVKDSMIRVQI